MNSWRFQSQSPTFYSVLATLVLWSLHPRLSLAQMPPLGRVGDQANYVLEAADPSRSSTVQRLVVTLGPTKNTGSNVLQWLKLDAQKLNAESFSIWLLAGEYPRASLQESARSIARYLLQETSLPVEYTHQFTGAAVLPSTGAWKFLWPRPVQGEFLPNICASQVDWLGHRYRLDSTNQNVAFAEPQEIRHLELLPDVLVGVPSNSRTKDNRRRYDDSDYEMVRLARDDYSEMIRAGMNCFRVDAEQAGWIANEPVFYWGIGGNDVPYPECLFRSTYLGPALFLDEPAVGTRDFDIRPRIAKDPAFRQALTPRIALEMFKQHFHMSVTQGAPTAFLKSLQARGDVDLGSLSFRQSNLYSWETMIATAAWELTAETDGGPEAIVFEPPGRVGTRRTLPELNMAYGCQLPPDNPANLSGIIFGFLRGAAREAAKSWGVSIYGQVDRSDSPWLLTHGYDLGASRFFFWDNYRLACVPYGECLALARHLHAHVLGHPERNLEQLKHAAEVAILLPPGYNLGHVHLGRGNLWGLGELNLERRNGNGVRYRQVMGNFFAEIEHCERLGVAFDLLWDLPRLRLDGYREIVRVREDGRIETTSDGKHVVRKSPRSPERPPGLPPRLKVQLAKDRNEAPTSFHAIATIHQGSAPIYYTTGARPNGVYQNVMVLWELYGPGEVDYRTLGSQVLQMSTASQPALIKTSFSVSQPGHYRLRAATTDLAGHSTINWKEFTVGD